MNPLASNFLPLACLLLTWNFLPSQGSSLTQGRVGEALWDLVKLIRNTEESGIKVLVPLLPRLALHDCIDDCDGCINLNMSHNWNLEKAIYTLEPLYLKYNLDMSRADFWVLAAKAALRVGVETNNERCLEESCQIPKIDFRFRYGRKDCISSPRNGWETNFLNPLSNSSQLFPWFRSVFGLKRNPVVVLMGLRMLGSGGLPLDGPWESWESDEVSNSLFKRISDPNHCWVQEYVSPRLSGLPHRVFYWRTDDFKSMALPVEMSLYKDIDSNMTTGESTCTFHECGNAKSRTMVNLYAKKADVWAQHVGLYFHKIVEKTTESLKWPSNSVVA